MRLFTAIDLPESIEEHLAALIARLRPLARLAWTRSEKLHVTTRFIGEWPEQRLEELKRALRGVGSPGAIEVAIGGLGWFPNARNPRVLWAGVHAGAALESLAHATDAAVHAIGVAKADREFTAHLTLARIRERVPQRGSQRGSLDALRDAIGKIEAAEFGAFRATAFHLYLSAAGRYTRLAEFGLTA
jgi:2'-5' RNA ligase